MSISRHTLQKYILIPEYRRKTQLFSKLIFSLALTFPFPYYSMKRFTLYCCAQSNEALVRSFKSCPNARIIQTKWFVMVFNVVKIILQTWLLRQLLALERTFELLCDSLAVKKKKIFKQRRKFMYTTILWALRTQWICCNIFIAIVPACLQCSREMWSRQRFQILFEF